VPLLLAYVYGVVPVSLCRSIGNCGIKTTSAGGVKIDFDDEEDCAAPASLSIGPFLSSTNIGLCSIHWLHTVLFVGTLNYNSFILSGEIV